MEKPDIWTNILSRHGDTLGILAADPRFRRLIKGLPRHAMLKPVLSQKLSIDTLFELHYQAMTVIAVKYHTLFSSRSRPALGFIRNSRSPTIFI
ncbi:MAG: hypothetical protein ACT4PZ_19735 [Panacagrimonas sp.]